MSRDSEQASQGPYEIYGGKPTHVVTDSDGDTVSIHHIEPVGDEPHGRVFLTAFSDLGGANSVELSPAELIALGEHLTDLGEELSS